MRGDVKREVKDGAQLKYLESQVKTNMEEVIQKYIAGTEKGAGLKAKNGFAKRKSTRNELNAVLKANGFIWVKEQELDVNQEPNNNSWALINDLGKEYSVVEALAEIYSKEKAFLIPRSGGKPKLIEPQSSWNVIAEAYLYGLL